MIAYQYADTGLSNGIDRAWSHLDQASGFFCLFVFQTPGIRGAYRRPRNDVCFHDQDICADDGHQMR